MLIFRKKEFDNNNSGIKRVSNGVDDLNPSTIKAL